MWYPICRESAQRRNSIFQAVKGAIQKVSIKLSNAKDPNKVIKQFIDNTTI